MCKNFFATIHVKASCLLLASAISSYSPIFCATENDSSGLYHLLNEANIDETNDSLELQNIALKRRLLQLDGQLQKALQEQQRQQQRLAESDQQQQLAWSSKQALQEQLNQQLMTNHALDQQLQAVQGQIAAQADDYNTAKTQLLTSYHQLQNERYLVEQKLAEQKKQHENALITLEQKQKTLRSLLTKISQKLEGQTQHLKEIAKEREQLLGWHKQQNEENTLLKQHLNESTQALDKQIAYANHLQDGFDELHHQLGQAQADQLALSEAMQEQQAQLKQAVEQNNQLIAEQQQLVDENELLREKLTHTENVSQEHMLMADHLAHQNKKHEKQYDRQNQLLSQAESTIESLQTELAQKEAQIASAQEHLKTTKNELDGQLAKFQKQQIHTLSYLQLKNKENNALKLANEQMHNTITKLLEGGQQPHGYHLQATTGLSYAPNIESTLAEQELTTDYFDAEIAEALQLLQNDTFTEGF